MTSTFAQQLLSILARISFKLGQFKLSSGGTSDYYIDCRTTTLHAEGGRLTGHAILELLEANKICLSWCLDHAPILRRAPPDEK